MNGKLVPHCARDGICVKYYCLTNLCANDEANCHFCGKCKMMKKHGNIAAHPPQAQLLRELSALGESLIGTPHEYNRAEIDKIARFSRKYRTYSIVFHHGIIDTEMRTLINKCTTYVCKKAGINIENDAVIKRCRDKFWVFVGATDAKTGRNLCADIDASAFSGSSLWFINKYIDTD